MVKSRRYLRRIGIDSILMNPKMGHYYPCACASKFDDKLFNDNWEDIERDTKKYFRLKQLYNEDNHLLKPTFYFLCKMVEKDYKDKKPNFHEGYLGLLTWLISSHNESTFLVEEALKKIEKENKNLKEALIETFELYSSPPVQRKLENILSTELTQKERNLLKLNFNIITDPTTRSQIYNELPREGNRRTIIENRATRILRIYVSYEHPKFIDEIKEIALYEQKEAKNSNNLKDSLK